MKILYLFFLFIICASSLYCEGRKISFLPTISINKEKSYYSLTKLIDKVINHHCSINDLNSFYTCDRNSLLEIIIQTLNDPDFIISDPENPNLKRVYKVFDFSRILTSLFIKQKRIKNGYDGKHLGRTPLGSTNRVVAIIREYQDTKGDKIELLDIYPD